MRILTDKVIRIQKNFWNNIHFHPADAIEDPWGQKYLSIAAENGIAKTVRMYSMLEDIVTRDENGRLRFDFTLNDQRMDFLVEKGFNLLVCYCFFPDCIVNKHGGADKYEKSGTRYKGKHINTEPPEDYTEWEEICYRYTRHVVDRYGIATVRNWYLQCWNEPHGNFLLKDVKWSVYTNEGQEEKFAEYKKIYTSFANALTRVSPELKLGGPSTDQKMFELMCQWVQETGIRLDWLSGHAYGTEVPELITGEIPFSVDTLLEDIKDFVDIRNRYYPEGKELLIDEWGASSYGFYNIDDCPPLILRENSQYAAYYGRMISRMSARGMDVDGMNICLSGSHQVYEKPDTYPEFPGFRSLFTEHFVRKPIFNAFILGSKLKHEVLDCVSIPDHMDVFPTRDGDDFSIMLAYASEHFDEPLPDAAGEITASVRPGVYQLNLWIIDARHNAPYEMSIRENMPSKPNAEQLIRLREESILKPALSKVIDCSDGTINIPYSLTNNALMLAELTYVKI